MSVRARFETTRPHLQNQIYPDGGVSMDVSLASRLTRLLNAWDETTTTERTGVGYELTPLIH